MQTGQMGEYFWIEWADKNLLELLQAFPEIVTGKYLVNTSFDSGRLSLSAEELEQGWKRHRSVSLSPKISRVRQVPYHQYDEWYLYSEQPAESTLEDIEVFINNYRFSLAEGFIPEIQNRFWRQMETLKPESYLAEGDNLVFATNQKDIFRRVSLSP